MDPAAFGFPAVDPGSKSVYNDPIIDLVGIVTQVTANYNQNKPGTKAHILAVRSRVPLPKEND